MVNKNIGSIGVFGSCKKECQKGEPVRLHDNRFLQANRCALGNICVVVSEEGVQDATVLELNPARPGAIYTQEELENLGNGNASLGMGRVLSAISQNPTAFVYEGEKPQATDQDFYSKYVDKLFI